MADGLFAPGADTASIGAALADPALASLDQGGAPVLVASCENRTVLFANRAARDLFGADIATVSNRLFRGTEPAVHRLAVLAATLLPGAAPRLERMRFYFGGVAEPLMFLCRRVGAPNDESYLLLAAPGVRAALLTHGARAGSGETRPPAATPTLVTARADRPTTRFRFLWRTDADHRLVEIGPEFLNFIGPGEHLEGRSFVDILRERTIDTDNALVGALAGRTTWSGIEAQWPLDGGQRSVPVEFGAAPSFDATKLFEGFRGYGLVHADRVAEDQRVAQDNAAAPTHPVEPHEADVAPVAHDPTPADVEVHEAVESNVVPLRPIAVVREPDPVMAQPTAALSASERTAFDEISRALAGLTTADGASPHDDATVTPLPVAAPVASDAPKPDILRTIIDRVPIGILVTRQSVPLFANRTMLDLTGYRDVDALHDSGGLERLFRAQEAQSPDEPSAATIECADGDKIAVDARIQAIDWEGLPATLVSLRRAVDPAHAARVRALESTVHDRDEEARELHAILDTATDGVLLLDREGNVRSLNRSAEALFGCDQGDVVGRPITALVAPESESAVTDYLGGLRDGGVASVLNDGREILCRAPRGGTIPVFMTIGRVGAGDAPKFCAVLRDLTEWKKAETGLNDARREAERASALKSDFLAKISHEIRTPLNAILGFAEVIMDERFGPVGNERYKDYMKDIHRSGEHVMSLVNDLLDLSKIEAGKMDMTFTATDANAVVSECVSLMQPQASRERVVMRLSLAPRLPKIVADERAFRQIVLNILSNAVKYNEPGGQVIVSTALTDAGHAVVRIRDTGLGMTESELEIALEPFRQVATTRSTGGTGLGLPLTKALVEANRASFTIKSRKNEGTLVEIAFPPSRVMAD